MKKIAISALVGVVLSVASYGAYKIQSSKETMSDFMLANIEALTTDEVKSEEFPCWRSFVGGLSSPRQCPSCIRLPFSTGVGAYGSCVVIGK